MRSACATKVISITSKTRFSGGRLVYLSMPTTESTRPSRWSRRADKVTLTEGSILRR